LEQQQASKFISDCESDFSTFAECLKDRYEPEVYNQFENQVEPMITDDIIDNYIFSVDSCSYDLNTSLSLSFEHYSKEEVIVFDDHNLITKEQEGHQSSSREVSIDVKLFPKDQ